MKKQNKKKYAQKKQNENTFTVKDADGNERECEVLFTFESEETNKNYIVYTDNTEDEDGNIRVYASVFVQKQGKNKLEAIETEREWKIVEAILGSIQEENIKDEKEDN